MSRLLITLGAVAAWFLLGHFGLAAILLYVWAAAMTSTSNTAKTRAVEQRVNSLVTSLGNISGKATGEPVISGTVVYTADVNVSGSISQTSDIYGSINGGTSSGGPNAGSGVAAHTHGIGHVHSHGHDHSYGHTHTLPNL